MFCNGNQPTSHTLKRANLPASIPESALATTMRPQFNVSDEVRALRPQFAATEENWKPVDPETAERWAIVISAFPAGSI